MSDNLISVNDDLADCLLTECEYMEINPVVFDTVDDFKRIYNAFIDGYASAYAVPKNGFISFDKLFDLFCNIYTIHFKGLEENIKAPFGDEMPPNINEYVRGITFSGFLNRFHDYFTERIDTSKYNGMLEIDKLFDLFCAMYDTKRKKLKDIKASFDNGAPLVIKEHTNEVTFSSYIKGFCSKSANKVPVKSDITQESHVVDKDLMSEGKSSFVFYSYNKRSLDGFIDELTSHQRLQ